MAKTGLTVSVDLSTVTELQKYADDHRTNRSQLVAWILDSWVKGKLIEKKPPIDVKCYKCGAEYTNIVGNCPVCSKEVDSDGKK